MLQFSSDVRFNESQSDRRIDIELFEERFNHARYHIVGSAFGAVSTAVVGRGVSLTLSILAISPAASGAAIVLDLVNINYITVNLVR